MAAWLAERAADRALQAINMVANRPTTLARLPQLAVKKSMLRL